MQQKVLFAGTYCNIVVQFRSAMSHQIPAHPANLVASRTGTGSLPLSRRIATEKPMQQMPPHTLPLYWGTIAT